MGSAPATGTWAPWKAEAIFENGSMARDWPDLIRAREELGCEPGNGFDEGLQELGAWLGA